MALVPALDADGALPGVMSQGKHVLHGSCSTITFPKVWARACQQDLHWLMDIQKGASGTRWPSLIQASDHLQEPALPRLAAVLLLQALSQLHDPVAALAQP